MNYNYEELSKLLKYNDELESKLYMPNEIFEDLINNVKNTPHIAFAYTYIYLITWLYRYCKYYGGNDVISNSSIKSFLGYSPDTRTINYLIKKNGLLDKIGYTITDRDMPISVDHDGEELNFSLISELDDKSKETYSYESSAEKYLRDTFPMNFTFKYPVKAFERMIDEDGKIGYGTFYEVDNTHLIPFDIFLYCMTNENINCTGFYLYAYLKHKNDIYGGYDVSLENLVEETGIAERTLDKYLGMLKKYKMIDFKHNQKFFAIGMRKEDRMANTYYTNEYHDFSDKPVPYNKIEIVKKEDYLKMIKKEEEEKRGEDWGSQITTAELPF